MKILTSENAGWNSMLTLVSSYLLYKYLMNKLDKVFSIFLPMHSIQKPKY
jgi:hypothetical protein